MYSHSAEVVPTIYILEVELLGQKVHEYAVLLNVAKFTTIGIIPICISIIKLLVSSHPCQQNMLLVGEMGNSILDGFNVPFSLLKLNLFLCLSIILYILKLIIVHF